MSKLTTKKILFNILSFSLPYLLACLLQTLYGMADLYIVGQYVEGSVGTSAVSNGTQVMHMLTVMIVGLAMGTTVTIGKSVGARDKSLTSKIIGNTVVVFAVVSVVLTVILLFLVRGIVNVMNIPCEAAEGTVDYLTVCFIGIPFITAYNVLSSIYRGMGNSRTPTLFVGIACVVNIALDYLFIGGMGMGTVGAALGTVISQGVSVVIALLMIRRGRMGIEVKRGDFGPSAPVVKDILKVGVPIALQDGFVQIAFVLIMLFANMRGLADSAAVGIVEKIIGILFLVPSAMLSTISALSAIYVGGGDERSARKTLGLALLITVSFGLVWVGVMLVWAEEAVALFTDDAVAITLGGQYMRGYVWDCVFAGIHFCFSGYFCAVKRSGLSFMHNLVSILLARIPLSYLASVHFVDSLFPMGLATVVGSVISALICLVAYLVITRRRRDNLLSTV